MKCKITKLECGSDEWYAQPYCPCESCLGWPAPVISAREAWEKYSDNMNTDVIGISDVEEAFYYAYNLAKTAHPHPSPAAGTGRGECET